MSALSLIPVSHPVPLSNKLADIADIANGGISRFAHDLPSDFPLRLLPRKWWEQDKLAAFAEASGVLTDRAVGLGLGVGHEPIIFYFARKSHHVIATDLYDNTTDWSEARFSSVEAVYNASPFPLDRRRLHLRNADMRAIPMPDHSVDYIWSCSSIEHVHSLRQFYNVLVECHRLLKPNGLLFLSTEFSLTPQRYLLPGVLALSHDLVDVMILGNEGFEMVGPINLSYNWTHPGNAARPRRYLPASMIDWPARLLLPEFRWGGIANPVGLSMIAPIAICLRKTAKAVVPWDVLALPQMDKTFTNGIDTYYAQRYATASGILRECYEAFSKEGDEQMRQIAFRFYIDAAVRSGQPYIECAREIRAFLTALTDGRVQDADCLDLSAYILGEAGDVGEAARIYRMCALSPSTSMNHVFECSLKMIAYATKAGRRGEAVRSAAEILVDMINAGLPVGHLAFTIEKTRREGWGDDRTLREVVAHVAHEAAGAERRYRELVAGYTEAMAGSWVAPSNLGRIAQRLGRRWLRPGVR